jgi:hypothetical protein
MVGNAGVEQLATTASLSQKMSALPSGGTPNIRSLYLQLLFNWMQFFNATISDPKVLDSTVFCFLLCQITGARLRNIKIAVWLRVVTTFPAKFASTKQLIDTGLPKESGALGGIAFSKSL